MSEDKPEPKPTAEVPPKEKPLKDRILEAITQHIAEGSEFNRELVNHIAEELDCSTRYIYQIHKATKEKPIQKPIQSLQKFADIEQMLKEGLAEEGIDEATIEEVHAIPPVPKPAEKKEEEEVPVIPLTEKDVKGLVEAANIWVKRMLPPELSKEEIGTLAKAWTPVLNKLMPSWGAEIMCLIMTGIIFAPRVYERAAKVKAKKEEEGKGGSSYDELAK